MPYVPEARHTLHIPSGPSGSHLFIVCTPCCKYGHHLLVNFSTVKSNDKQHDGACLVSAGEHPFVKVNSYIAYRHARTTDAAHLSHCVDKKYFKADAPVSEALLKRVIDAFPNSYFVKPRILNYLKGGAP